MTPYEPNSRRAAEDSGQSQGTCPARPVERHVGRDCTRIKRLMTLSDASQRVVRPLMQRWSVMRII